uniref:Uncharacterized protein n=1 Tax=Dunaliella tertiolecta TaxID=3047 RepID=A0A7S3QYD4_DUNTE|mmetsp:Transcript_31998/g.83326  ORF Transcript_31998/g.83326 Transcript_31998/m.83326 type:complete len:294 (-) Transcript_31998:765-1646(-)
MQKDKYIIVTGGNRGIGFEAVRGLMAEGAHVVMASRDQKTCQAAAEKLREQGLTGSCDCKPLDLEDFASVRAFAASQEKELKARRQALAVLINNGGVMGLDNAAPSEGDGGLQDRHMRINHLGGFLLSNLLRPSMQPGSRIVNLSSRAHYGGSLKWGEDGQLMQHPTWWFPQYCRSKLANTVSTAEMQRRWAKPYGIIATSVSPGLVQTNIFSSMPWGMSYLSQPFLRFFARSPAQGAETVIHAAIAPEYNDPEKVPLFLHDCKPMTPLAASHDEKNGKLLWDWSEKMVGLSK